MKHKISWMAILRLAVQLLFFFLLPGLVAETFHGIQILAETISKGYVHDIHFWQQILSTGLVVLGTFFLGRFFCGWICAFGTLGDLFHLLGSKVFRIKVNMNETLDGWLKAIKYVVLIFIVAAVWIGGLSWFKTWSPWDAFGMLNDFPPDFMYAFSELTIGTCLLVFFMLGSMFIERFFCRYFCPLGAVLSIFSFLRIGRIKKPRKECGKCKVCTNHCAMGIGLYRSNTVYSGECIDCMQCISPCPRKNVNFTVATVDATPLVATIAAVTMTGMYYGGNISIPAFINSFDISVSTPADDTVKDDIFEVAPPEQPSDTTPPQVGEPTTEPTEPPIEAQPPATTKPPVASQPPVTTKPPAATQPPATTKPPVETQPPATTQPPTTTPEPTEPPAQTAAPNPSGYIDGTYQGSGVGYKRRTTTVSITIKNGKVTDIKTVSTGDDGPYYNRAFSYVSAEIIDNQDTSVDAVSGATYSSNGIMSAVADALLKAKG